MIEQETETEFDKAIFCEIARVHGIYISNANNTTSSSYNLCIQVTINIIL